MDTVLKVRQLAWKKGYDALYLGEFFRVDGTSYHSMKIYNEATGDSFTESPEACLEWLKD